MRRITLCIFAGILSTFRDIKYHYCYSIRFLCDVLSVVPIELVRWAWLPEGKNVFYPFFHFIRIFKVFEVSIHVCIYNIHKTSIEFFCIGKVFKYISI